MITPLLKVLAPVAILAGGFAGAAWLNATAPQVPAQAPPSSVPLVEVQTVHSGPRVLSVDGHGEARAARQVTLVAEIAARVLWVAPELESGDFVAADAPLVRLDSTDYALARDAAEARLAQAQAALRLEEAEAAIAREDWQAHGEGAIPALVAREPQLARAAADVRAAEAARDAALRDLERCEVRAPFAARVEARAVTIGSFVAAGSPLASLADAEAVEVTIPVRLADLDFLGLSLGRDPAPREAALTSAAAPSAAPWTGQVVRTGAQLDPRSRMASVIVRVDGPYEREPALLPGSFLRARISGRRVDAVVAIPRAALRDDDTVLLADSQDRLQIRPVEILQRTASEALVRSGLQDGERLIVTPLVTVVADMPVRVAEPQD